MMDLLAWLISFFIVIAILAIILFQLVSLSDLEFDYINPYDSASRINSVVMPEFITQASLCLLHLITGHWLMFLLCLPYAYYNFRLYTDKRHLVDVTEIFNQLPWEKKLRMYKLGYLVILLSLSDDLVHRRGATLIDHGRSFSPQYPPFFRDFTAASCLNNGKIGPDFGTLLC